MKLQAKISLTLILSVVIAIALSFTLLNVFILFVDRSYSWYDLEVIASGAARDLSSAPLLDRANAAEILAPWKAKYPNLSFTLTGDKREPVYATDERPQRRRPEIEEIRRRLEEEQRQAARAPSVPRFIDTMDRAPYLVMKPVITAADEQGRLSVSVRRDFFLPFYIRVNDEKIADAYLILFGALAAVIALSFLLVFLLTSPLVRRLRALYAGINAFELGRPLSGGDDPRRDEIGFVRNTFNRMAERIHQDYNERLRFFRERQSLLRNISHDFRTPLTSILGYAVSLEEGVYDDEAEQKKYYSIIRRKAEYMTKLFNEMMELTRLDSDAYVLHPAEFNLGELLREIIIEYLPQLETAGFAIETDIPETLTCRGDRERLSRALRNLIDNVITHAAAGRFLGVALRSEERAGRPGLRLEVRDHGPGVADTDRPRVFDRFYSAGEDGRGSGMGLGLAIAREIVEKHGGTIELLDHDGPGALFSVWLGNDAVQSRSEEA